MPIDVTRLISCRKQGEKTVAQCPVCALGGNDINSKNHLVIFPDGKYGCVVDRSDEHSKAIWRLVGVGSFENANLPLSEPVEPKVEIERIWPADCLQRLIPEYSYWEKRGISEETLKPFKGGVATTGQMANRWVFPIFNSNDQIIGFTGRSLKEGMNPKWKHLSPVKNWVWGGLEEIEEKREIILVESPGDLLMLREHGVGHVLCLFGVNISQAVLGHIIATNPDRVIISTNFDEIHKVGQNASIRIKNILDKFFNPEKIIIKLPPVKDWGVATREQIHESFKDGADLEI